MIYLILICTVLVTLLLFLRSEYRTIQMISMFLMLLFFLLSFCFFILYFCKSSFNLSVFQKYFQVPRDVAAKLYLMRISRVAVIKGLNLNCIFFVIANIFFASSFLKKEGRKRIQRLWPCAMVLFILEYLLCNPDIYMKCYSFLYPRYMTPVQIEEMWEMSDRVIGKINLFLFAMCLGIILFHIIKVPHIKVYRMSLLIVLLSYFVLIICFFMLMGRLPMQMIRYSKAMDIVTYKMLFADSRVPLYRTLPYVLLVMIALLVIWSYRLNILRRKMENYSLEVSKSIHAANMSTKVFCHFMKNELLNLQAELEDLDVEEKEEGAKKMLVEHCEMLYGRLDDIHKYIKENVMNQQQLRLDSIVTSTVQEMKQARPEKDIMWKVVVPEEECHVFADGEYLKQALINLMNNACDALKIRLDKCKSNGHNDYTEPGKICVRVLSDSKWGIVEIADNGCGIPRENMVNIFTPFFSSKPMTKSWGMGLSLTHKIITDSGGKIDVESEVDQGTVFHIYLPICRI